ncbi:hypothetical protein DFH06DRAFT_1176975 [Mycena polygramma]|nr:hypothetical protein DFH06DRAFT_1176975 [Mycena polygramma]
MRVPAAPFDCVNLVGFFFVKSRLLFFAFFFTPHDSSPTSSINSTNSLCIVVLSLHLLVRYNPRSERLEASK